MGSLSDGVSKHMEILDCVFPAPKKTGQLLGYYISMFR